MKNKLLFILKHREDYNTDKYSSSIGLSTGLYNSASFVSNHLKDKLNIDSDIEVVIDNNDIDRVVTQYKPTHVIIEALWVVPEKFEILSRLHPDVKWIIRIHSEMPFMANEGIAMRWIGEYVKHKNVFIGINSPRMLREIQLFVKECIGSDEKVLYQPNIYPYVDIKKKPVFNKDKEFIDIGCFGAVRPLKNHLIQAHAALEFANAIGKKLRFHINSGRIEMKGDPVLHNLKGFFDQIFLSGHRLVNLEWTPHEQFLEYCAKIDIGIQVSFTETFNIVTADLISQGVPIVVSNEVPWSAPGFRADPTDSKDIFNMIMRTYKYPELNVSLNQAFLNAYSKKTSKIWQKQFS
jgi:hypothetical protein